jgi:NTP pyrophosphatase (non-canonical NTP hydrolase)
METKEYLQESLKTLNYDFNANDKDVQVLIHGKDGLVTEVGELLENVLNSREGVINFKEELGDIDWYQAIFLRTFPVLIPLFDSTYETLVAIKKAKQDNRKYDGFPNNFLLVSQLSVAISYLADDFKRLVFYGKPPKNYDGPKYENLLDCYAESIVSKMGKIMGLYLAICVENNVDPSEVRNINIAKLRKRHGETFNKVGVFERDLQAEEKAMVEAKQSQDGEDKQ